MQTVPANIETDFCDSKNQYEKLIIITLNGEIQCKTTGNFLETEETLKKGCLKQ